jgi:hypothetical protein
LWVCVPPPPPPPPPVTQRSQTPGLIGLSETNIYRGVTGKFHYRDKDLYLVEKVYKQFFTSPGIFLIYLLKQAYTKYIRSPTT